QSSGDNSQRSAFFNVTRRTKETLGLFQRMGIDTTSQHLTGAWNYCVVGTRQAGNGVKQNYYVLFVLNQTLGLLDHHLGDLYVARWRLVKGRGNYFTAHSALHFGYFFRTLVNQQHNQVTFWIVAGD